MERNPIVKVGWSGGKDSTCAVMQHLIKGHRVKAVCYVPMFTETIPLIAKDHYEFILHTADRLREAGAEVHIVFGMSYCEYVMHRAKKGKYRGEIFGFPYICSGQCGFKRDSKLKALLACNVGEYDYEDIGLAADELSRHKQLSESKRSILMEMGITEADAKAFCEKHGLLSPHYARSGRDGCALCPNAKDEEIARWLADYPQALSVLLQLQEYVKKERPDRDPPRRNYKWFV